MGYLRKKSFMFFLDADAPVANKTLSKNEIEEIELKHNENKKQRIENLITSYARQLGQTDEGYLLERENEEQLGFQGLMTIPSLSFSLGTFGQHYGNENSIEELNDKEKKPVEELNDKKTKTDEELANEERIRKESQASIALVEERLRKVANTVKELDNDTNVLHEYIRKTFRAPSEMPWRTFCHEVHKIAHSQAELPDNSYKPRGSTGDTVRFRQDGYLGVNVPAEGKSYDSKKGEWYDNGERNPALWVTVDEGWEKDGNWGGYLQISCVTQNNKYIDSSNGWVLPVSSKADKVTFYDMGNYYEIWQKDRESGRPLTVEGNILRFVSGATPAKWNIVD
ncbi:hypothetical protein [Acinetobacter sp.]|uniref:hypothetical protein n=1 Tax=Acinetobacter sp. TaxID=472 RepID=UPI00105F32A0|nr:hypothetical protein C5B72_10690 [Acinetobacter sp. KU 011TH]TDM63639.1 hypothetical protein C4608_10700 [Acinetobacter sp. KU 013TH]